ncbi:HIT family protein [Paraherbaspirillum soli]|uniref:HIT family protein n=1 Tax=Paraherbaspirillum soli TaxID=631222 RepID=A0ABW0M3X9_9BURK
MAAHSEAGELCELCTRDGGEVLHYAEKYRVVLVADALYPGFCRVIWNAHVKEMTDLASADRSMLMEAVWVVETAVRNVMQPDKINLACFGNMTPHLHWHVIPRYLDDAHFPHPVWAEVQRTSPQASLSARQALLAALRSAISAAL